MRPALSDQPIPVERSAVGYDSAPNITRDDAPAIAPAPARKAPSIIGATSPSPRDISSSPAAATTKALAAALRVPTRLQ